MNFYDDYSSVLGFNVILNILYSLFIFSFNNLLLDSVNKLYVLSWASWGNGLIFLGISFIFVILKD